MRFVDIDQLVLPVGWQARAQQALDDLRDEIANAEAVAQSAGGDPIAARKSAISAGLTSLPGIRLVSISSGVMTTQAS
jgi:hypothetical protein